MTAEPATSPLVLRRLSSSDDLAGALALMTGYVMEIRRKLFDGYGLELEEATPDSDQLVAITGLVEPPQCLYLAEVDGRPAGTCGLKEVGPGVAEIKRMYVDPALRGSGVARALLDRVIADGRAAGYRTLQLETAVWMVEAHALYRSCGFTDAPPFPDPEFGCFPGCDHLARYMTLTLEEP
jgi:GNAT superfamily N-acetyltransferase